MKIGVELKLNTFITFTGVKDFRGYTQEETDFDWSITSGQVESEKCTHSWEVKADRGRREDLGHGTGTV